jgi:hypothetical protein
MADTSKEDRGNDIDHRIERQEATLERLLEWIRAVDGKIPIVIGFATAMLAVTGALSPKPTTLTWGTGLLMAIGSLPLVVSLCFCAAAISPRLTGPHGSMIYFGGIAALTRAKYGVAILGRSDAEYLDDLIDQCHRNAKIAEAKYSAVRMALLWLFLGTPGWLISGYLLYNG